MRLSKQWAKILPIASVGIDETFTRTRRGRLDRLDEVRSEEERTKPT